ncbi:MAG: hypothetical protein RSC10_06055 [Longicatena sp.]
MKRKIAIGIGIAILVIALIFAMKPKSFSQQIEKEMKNMDSYILQGNMEVTKGEDIKTYALEVGYKKSDKDLFKVSLTDKELNQEQIILRNKSGVYVVTPSINQVFKFEGNWPMNSPKPYLLQSIVDIAKKKNAIVKKSNKGYLVSDKVVYPSNKNFDHEEIMFDKNMNIKWLQIFNKDNISEVKIVFTKSDYDAKIKNDYFNAPTNMESKTTASIISEKDLPLYPVMVYEAKLDNANEVNVNNEIKHVLEYKGNKNFTVVESVKKNANTTQTVIMPGEMIDTLDIVGVYDGNRLSAIYNNIEFTVFSEELGPEEMMAVINSMQVAVMK